MPSDAILKEEGTIPPMPEDAFVKEEVVVFPMPPDAIANEDEEVVPPMLPDAAVKPAASDADELGSASDSDDGFPEPDVHLDQREAWRVAFLSNEEDDLEAARRLQQQFDENLGEDKSVQVANDLGGSSADQQEALRVASLSNEELAFDAAQRLGSSVAEQQKVLDIIATDIARTKAAAQLRQIVDAFDRGTEAVAALLQAGVDVNAAGHEGRDGHGVGNTALHVAAMRGLTALVKLLLERGANASIKNGTGKTAAQLAAKTKLERGRGQYDRPRAGCAGCLALLEAHAKAHGASVASSKAAGGDAAGSSATSGATSGSSKKPAAAKKRAAGSSSSAAAAAPAVFASVPAALPAAAAAAAGGWHASAADLKIGSRVSVWWADDNAWYAGTVKSCSRTRGVCVVFDKQEGEDDCTMYYESFAEENWKMARAALPPPPPPPPASGASCSSSKAQGKRRART